MRTLKHLYELREYMLTIVLYPDRLISIENPLKEGYPEIYDEIYDVRL